MKRLGITALKDKIFFIKTIYFYDFLWYYRKVITMDVAEAEANSRKGEYDGEGKVLRGDSFPQGEK